ncbi:MAG: hypothetical protein PVJ90_00660 [Pseudomonadales bacterium]|jgi:outer membrane lipopolysaccharide assembly protein LptE/RlpB
MRLRSLAIVGLLLLSGCGYQLVGYGNNDLDARLKDRLALDIADPLGAQARMIESIMHERGVLGAGLTLEVLDFTLERRTLSELTDRDEFELRVSLTYAVREGDAPYLIGPETLNRDGFLTLLDSNSDSLDTELERLKADAIYRDLVGQMLTQISAQADQLP